MKTILLGLTLVFLLPLSPARASNETHMKSIRELFQALELEKMMESAIQQSVDMLAQQTSQPAKARPKIEKFMVQTVGFRAVETDLVKLYQKYFTESEIQDLLKFYRTPTGKKMAKVQPALFKEGAAIGQAKMIARQQDLQQILQEFRKK